MAKVTPRKKASRPATTKTSAKPGTKDASAGDTKKAVKVLHPALEPNDEGKPTKKLTEVPSDFDPKLHKPLKKGDFENEAVFMRMKADELEAKAKKLREDAEVVEKLGNKADRAKAKKLRAMQEKMTDLRKQLEEQGIDVDELLGDDDEEDE